MSGESVCNQMVVVWRCLCFKGVCVLRFDRYARKEVALVVVGKPTHVCICLTGGTGHEHLEYQG